MYWNQETGKYDLMRQLQDMANAREKMKRIPLPKLDYVYTDMMGSKIHNIHNAIIPPLPPLKVFLGWTPMKEFIGKLGPAKFGVGVTINYVECKGPLLTPGLIALIQQIDLSMLKIQSSLGVKIEYQGNEKRR